MMFVMKLDLEINLEQLNDVEKQDLRKAIENAVLKESEGELTLTIRLFSSVTNVGLYLTPKRMRNVGAELPVGNPIKNTSRSLIAITQGLEEKQKW